jgi:hypothetical protein
LSKIQGSKKPVGGKWPDAAMGLVTTRPLQGKTPTELDGHLSTIPVDLLKSSPPIVCGEIVTTT